MNDEKFFIFLLIFSFFLISFRNKRRKWKFTYQTVLSSFLTWTHSSLVSFFLILRWFSFSLQFFFRIYVIRECTNTPNKVDRTESERFSRRRLPRHERQNRILQNIPWHARMWPVRHKRWLTRHTQPRQLRQRGT